MNKNNYYTLRTYNVITKENFKLNKNYMSVDNIDFLKKIPDIKKNPLKYIFEDMNYKHKKDTLWLEFGVFTGNTINYISKFTDEKVYGFDSFEGLPEKWRDSFDEGAFNLDGNLPNVNENVVLVKGWFNDTLPTFIKTHNKKISFIHIDCDLYSSTKFIFDTLKDYIDDNCVISFDELVNYPGYKEGELKAFIEYINSNNINFKWIGMDGIVNYNPESDLPNQQVAVIVKTFNQ
jgi:hypothetical protein